ncbi:RloB family protein [Streptomyces iconiensis]|uniref:RloB family protein n=1 Tax=Streptomyces iconiensis TaxID=1384038 RepID=A0ABT7A771_9ACTN|nr:RloB family protein [Streptomyces iconiensis]MDJ1137194.1 RloB family protein [Streptomyces iconiensis]
MSEKRRSKAQEAPPLSPFVPEQNKRENILYVGCEGESTEPDYLDHLNEAYGEAQSFRIHPVSVKNGLLPEQTVAAVREHAENAETWVLFDRDRHVDIPQAVEEAAEDSTEICFSHPSFDLWLLLHFQAFGGKQSGSSKLVKDKLRDAHPAFKRFDQRNDKSVQGPRRAALKGKEQDAVAHAKALVSQCEHGACKASQRKVEPVDRTSPENPDHLPQSWRKWSARSGHALDCPILDRDPSTDVWRLLLRLGIVKDKS